jgi:nucleoside-diphosphate-sugar epimerase/putative sterol carrier protein
VGTVKKLKVAVTGGSGQLGTHVLRRLLADRAIGEVVSLDLRPPLVASTRLKWAIADVRDSDFHTHLEGCDALVHLAFVVTKYLPRPEFDAINVGGSRNVFEAAARAGITRIAYSSSVAAYGVLPGHPTPITEDTPRKHQVDFAYSATKFEVEAFLDEFEKRHPEITVSRFRPTILIGTVMDHALGDALQRRVLPDSGTTPMPIVWDEDVADAFVLAVKQGVRGAFNLCTDDAQTTAVLARENGLRALKIPRSVGKVLFTVASKLGLGRDSDPKWLSAAEGAVLLPTNAKARSELGWKPKCPTASSVIARYVESHPGRLDRRLDVFFRLVEMAGSRGRVPEEAKRMNARIHLQLTGPGGGDFAILIDEGRLAIARQAPRPPSAVITLRASTLLELLAGKTDVTTAQLTGRIRVEGEGLQGMFIGGLVSMFRAQTERRGPVGFATRQMAHWFKGGAT